MRHEGTKNVWGLKCLMFNWILSLFGLRTKGSITFRCGDPECGQKRFGAAQARMLGRLCSARSKRHSRNKIGEKEMNLIKGTQYKVVPNHSFHADRIGYFEFLGGPDRDVIVLSDLQNPNSLFAVGMHDLTDFNPTTNEVIERFSPHDYASAGRLTARCTKS